MVATLVPLGLPGVKRIQVLMIVDEITKMEQTGPAYGGKGFQTRQ